MWEDFIKLGANIPDADIQKRIDGKLTDRRDYLPCHSLLVKCSIMLYWDFGTGSLTKRFHVPFYHGKTPAGQRPGHCCTLIYTSGTTGKTANYSQREDVYIKSPASYFYHKQEGHWRVGMCVMNRNEYAAIFFFCFDPEVTLEESCNLYNTIRFGPPSTSFSFLVITIVTYRVSIPPGNPKSVMISHDNLTWTSRVVMETNPEPFTSDDRSVSYLPLSHIAAQVWCRCSSSSRSSRYRPIHYRLSCLLAAASSIKRIGKCQYLHIFRSSQYIYVCSPPPCALSTDE